MTTGRRSNGSGSLIRRSDGGVWIAVYTEASGKRRKRSTRTAHRADAERIMRGWIERVALEREGLVAPEGGSKLQRHAARPVTEHLDAFSDAKLAEGRTRRHVDETRTMLEAACSACQWSVLADVDAESVERYIGSKRADTAGWSPRTAHKHITALKTFCRWCVADERLKADPLARLKKPAPTRQRERRVLTVYEWRWLRQTTDDGPDCMGMSGRSRRLLYELALQTGLRSGELRTLTSASFSLEGDRPCVLLQARQTKNRSSARQYIRRDLADDLAAELDVVEPGMPVFTMPRRESVARMLRADLQAARAAWLSEAGSDAEEVAARGRSPFLLARDSDGRVLDFHALRHTCGAWAAMGGASPKAVQTLMRHSTITLTLDTYGHLLPDEAAETVHRMPELASEVVTAMGTVAAGTTDRTNQDRTPQSPNEKRRNHRIDSGVRRSESGEGGTDLRPSRGWALIAVVSHKACRGSVLAVCRSSSSNTRFAGFEPRD